MEQNGAHHVNGGSNSREEQEEALVALIDHRTREVKNLRQRIAYYTSKVVASSSFSQSHSLAV